MVIIMVIRLPMSEKEISEARRAGIYGEVISKMDQGLELDEYEKEAVRSCGKVYVLGHVKHDGVTKVHPQLRDLPKGSKIPKSELDKLWRATLRDYRGIRNGQRTIMYMDKEGRTTVAPIEVAYRELRELSKLERYM